MCYKEEESSLSSERIESYAWDMQGERITTNNHACRESQGPLSPDLGLDRPYTGREWKDASIPSEHQDLDDCTNVPCD